MNEIVAYVPMEKELMRLTEVRLTSDPTKVLKLTPASKMLYRYMLDRYQHFTRLNKQFFDNQEALAEAIGVTSRTVLNLIKDMVEFGLITKKATKTFGAAHSNSYVVLDIFDKSKFLTGSSGKLFEKRQSEKPVETKSVRSIHNAHTSEFDDIDCPF